MRLAFTLLLTVTIVIMMAACSERFRYPCQDPANWSAPACQRPECAINGVCPDQLNRATDMKQEGDK